MMKAQLTDPGMFNEHLRRKGLRESSINLYSDVVTLFLTKYDIVDDLNLYNDFLIEHAYKKRSYYFYHAIRAFIKWKIEDQSVKTTLLKNLVKPKNDDPEQDRVYLSHEQREKVIESLENEKHRLIAKLQEQTGARIGDVLRLKRGSISYENYEGKLAMKIAFIGKRGRKSNKWIFDKKLQEDIMAFIKEHYLNDDYYFIDFSKAWNRSSEYTIIRTNYNWYWQDLKKALDKCHIDKDRWATHDFRRSISRDIWDDEKMGKDVQLLQNYLGHKNTSTTLRYLKHSGLSNRDVSKRLAEKQNMN